MWLCASFDKSANISAYARGCLSAIGAGDLGSCFLKPPHCPWDDLDRFRCGHDRVKAFDVTVSLEASFARAAVAEELDKGVYVGGLKVRGVFGVYGLDAVEECVYVGHGFTFGCLTLISVRRAVTYSRINSRT